jgi:hypothetical protein
VQRAVNDEQGELVDEGHIALLRADGRDGQGDDQRAQIFDAVRTAQAGNVDVEREHVRGVIFAQVALVEALHGTRIGDRDGDRAWVAQAAGLEGGDDGITQQSSANALGVARVDVDLDDVLRDGP